MTQPTLEDLEAAFRNTPFLRQLAMQLSGSRHQDAEDLLQEAWLTAQRNPPREGSSLGNWFARVLRSRATERRLSESRRNHREQVAARPEAIGANMGAEKLEIQSRLMGHLLALKPDHREVLYLRYFENLPAQVIAEKLNAPVKTISSRLLRAREELRQRLDRESGGDRQKWLTALIPLLPAPVAPSGVGLIPGASIGAPLIMKKWLLAVTALCLLLGGAAYLALQANSTGLGTDEANQALIAVSQGTKAPPADPLPEPIARTTVRQQILAEGSTREDLGSLLITLKSESGQLLPDVEMEIRAKLPGTSRQELLLLRTDQAGQAHFENLLPGEVFVATSTVWKVTKATIEAGVKTTLDYVRPPGETIEFTITDESGSPAPFAEIWGEPKWSQWSTLRKLGVTNAVGQLLLTHVGSSARFGARSKGHIASATVKVESLPAGTANRLKAELVLGAPGGTCHGQVRDVDGNPVAGATVVAGPRGGFNVELKNGKRGTAPNPACVRTDESGHFTLPSDLPLGTQSIWVTAPGWPAWSGSVDIVLGHSQPVDVRLTPGGILEGQLLDSEGQPVAAGRVRIAKEIRGGWYEHFVPPPTATTDSTGHFRIEGIPPGLQEVNASPTWKEPNRGKAKWSYKCLPDTVTQVDLVLNQGQIITGIVMDGDGKPLPDWRVGARSANPLVRSYPRNATTDTFGKFLLVNLGEGSHNLSFGPGGSYTHTMVKIHDVEAGTLDLIVTVDLAQAPSAWVEGTLGASTEDGSGIAPNARLLLWKSDSDSGLFVQFDNHSGRFRHGPLSPGRYQLQIAHDMKVQFSGEWFDLRPGESKNVGVLTPTAPGTIELTLGGLPANTDSRFRLSLDREGMATQDLVLEDGFYKTAALVPGRWLLTNRTEPWHIPSTWIEIRSGETTRLEIPVDLGQENSVSVKVENPDDPWKWMQVEVFDAQGQLVFAKPKFDRDSARDGKIRLFGLSAPAGSYTLKAKTDSGLSGEFPLQLAPMQPMVEFVLR